MKAEEYLRRVGGWRAGRRPADAVRLGQELKGLFDGTVQPTAERLMGIDEVWGTLLPAGLLEHCRLREAKGSVLVVEVDSPVYAHELRLCKGELLEELGRRCGGARIRDIKTVVGS